jgi:hypothetical protein
MSKKDPRSAAEILSVLVKAGIKNVILNACESGKTSSSNDGANLAKEFLRGGIPFVLAIAYQVNEEAVEIFMKNFYQGLLVKRVDIIQAAERSRVALLKDPGRRASLRHEVILKDYIVPVVYRSENTPPLALPQVKISLKKRLMQKITVRHNILDQPIHLIGRDTHILELELLLTVQKLLLLRGQGGCGKTALLQYCVWWWQTTNWVTAAIYLDLNTYSADSFTLVDLRVEICKKLEVEDPLSIKEDELVSILQDQNCLLVMDSVDLDDSRIPKKDQTDIKNFLSKASQGKTIIILSSRKWTSVLGDFDRQRNIYPLAGLPMAAAMVFAENVAFKGRAWPAKIGRNRESLNYFERTLILLERNPLAIQLTFPSLGTVGGLEDFFRQLLTGKGVGLEESVASSSRLTRVIRMIQLFQSADSLMFKLVHLAPFWNVIPTDLRNYWWYLILPVLKSDAKAHYEKATFRNWEDQEWRDLVNGSVNNLGYNTKFRKMVDDLLDASLMDKAVFSYSDGRTTDVYHINPVLTLFLQTSITNALRPILYSAFVNFHILNGWAKNERMMDERFNTIPTIFWDNERQHRDYSTNNLVSAFSYSVKGDIVDEIEHHGLSTADIMLKDIGTKFWTDKRTWEVCKPIVKTQWTRTMILPELRGLPGLEYNAIDVAHTLSNARLLVESQDEESETLIEVSLVVADTWSKKNRVMPPDLELNWFQLRHAEGIFIFDKDGPKPAMEIFERNLATDPKTAPDHELFNAIRRAQYASLQSWNNCVTMIEMATNPDFEKETTKNAKMIGGTHKTGKMSEYITANIDSPETDTTSVSALMSWSLEKEKASVEKFGLLAKQILAEPLVMNFSGLTPGAPKFATLLKELGGNNFDMAGAMNEKINELEFGVRALGEDTVGAKATLQAALAKETSANATNHDALIQLHSLLYSLAYQEEDWTAALQHLIESEKLHLGKAEPRDVFWEQIKFAKVYDSLDRPSEAGRAVLNALHIATNLKDQNLFDQCSLCTSKLPALEEHVASSNFLTMVSAVAAPVLHKLFLDEVMLMSLLLINRVLES